MTENQLITKYANHRAGQLSQTTIAYHCRCITELCECLNKPTSEITTEDIYLWVQYLAFLKGDFSQTIRIKLGGVRDFFDLCSSQHWLNNNPCPDNLSFINIYQKSRYERNEHINGGMH